MEHSSTGRPGALEHTSTGRPGALQQEQQWPHALSFACMSSGVAPIGPGRALARP